MYDLFFIMNIFPTVLLPRGPLQKIPGRISQILGHARLIAANVYVKPFPWYNAFGSDDLSRGQSLLSARSQGFC